MNHFTAGGDRETIRRQSLSKVTFVHVSRIQWWVANLNQMISHDSWDESYHEPCLYTKIKYNVLIKMFISSRHFKFYVLQVNFDNYKGMVACVNITDTHWKLLVSSDNHYKSKLNHYFVCYNVTLLSCDYSTLLQHSAVCTW